MAVGDAHDAARESVERWHFRQVLGCILPFIGTNVVFEVMAGLRLGDATLLQLACANLAMFGLVITLFCVSWPRPRSAMILAIGVFACVGLCSSIMPCAYAVSQMACVFTVALVLPFLMGWRLAVVMCLSVTLAMVASVRGFEAPIPPWPPYVRQGVEVLGSLAALFAMMLVLWQYNNRLRTELTEGRRLFVAAQDALQRRDEFLIIAAHELRTPLTALQLQLQLAMRAAAQLPASERLGKKLTQASSSVQRLCRLTEELLGTARLRQDAPRIIRQETDMTVLVTDVLQALEPQITRAGCTVQLHAAAASGWFDAALIEQVVLNLLNNATKFGRGKPIVVTLTSDSQNLQLHVADQGIGIDPVDHQRVFQAFERAVSANHFGGFGLGLAVSQKIVAAHGGHIDVQSELGKGALFTVVLPHPP